MVKKALLLVSLAFFLASCSVRHVVKTGYYPYPVMRSVKPGYTEVGTASWYGPNFHGKRTADGEVYNMYDHTAASKTLPFNTMVRVINLNNGRSTVVRINDRGPFVKNRIIDLSYAAAKDLGMIGTGTAPVKIVVLGKSYGNYTQSTITAPKAEEVATRKTVSNNGGVYSDYNDREVFVIQFGAFRRLYNAIRLRDRLSKYFRGIYISEKIVNGERFYRVVLGAFDSKDKALDYATRYVIPITDTYIVSRR